MTMENVFDFSRFWKYFRYDLRQAYSRYGVNLLMLGLMPVFFCVVWSIISLLLNQGWTTPDIGFRIGFFWVPFIALCIFFPSKLYGHLTDRRPGSEWLLIPASRLEKFLSMMLISLFVIPVAFLLLYVCADGLLSLVIPDYGTALVSLNLNQILAEKAEGIIRLTGGGFWLLWMMAAEYILVFLLGALCFRKAKVGYTILVLMGLGFLTSILGTLLGLPMLGPAMDMDEEKVEAMALQFVEHADFYVNLFLSLRLLILGGGLSLAIWFRLKALKH